MTRPTIRLEDRLAYLTPARRTPVRPRRLPTSLPRGVGRAAAGQRAPIRAPARRRAPLTWRRAAVRWLRDLPWSLLDVLGRLVRECWPAVAALALVVLLAGVSVQVALAPVVTR